jgi:hypothetical protein
MKKEINIKIVINNEEDKIATGVRMSGVNIESVSDILMLVGICENLKTSYLEKLKELGRIEKN